MKNLLDLKQDITNEIIASRLVFGRFDYIVDLYKGLIYDADGNYTENGRKIYDFIKKQDKKLTEIDNRPRDYAELYNY